MPIEKRWRVDIRIGEEGNETHAVAQLHREATREGSPELLGKGTARCNPADTNVPEIGDELAAARALSDLGHRLLHEAAEDIEAITREPVYLRE